MSKAPPSIDHLTEAEMIAIRASAHTVVAMKLWLAKELKLRPPPSDEDVMTQIIVDAMSEAVFGYLQFRHVSDSGLVINAPDGEALLLRPLAGGGYELWNEAAMAEDHSEDA